MFEYAESDPALPEKEAKAIIRNLRAELLNAQYRFLERQSRSLLILVGGIDGAGKGDTINLLHEWMDPRHIRTIAFEPATQEDKRFPVAYRFWESLPAKGQIGIVFGSGYAPLVSELIKARPNKRELEQMFERTRRLEADLVANDVQVIKLWFHLSKHAQQARTRHLLANPSTAWKVGPLDLKVPQQYEKMCAAGRQIIDQTNMPYAPWIIIPAADENMRNISTGKAVLAALQARSVRVDPQLDPAPHVRLGSHHDPLAALDYKVSLDKTEYKEALLHWQNRLAEAVRHPKFLKHHALILAFEGQDAAGKGGAIRRLTKALDARQYRVIPIAAPRQFELNRPYLWRFWKEVPPHGRITIFDRSWYGRVLVERVEKLALKRQWARAYSEINFFEAQLAAHGVIILKFWLAITEDEQLKRFEERQNDPAKKFKITDEDWRNRSKWSEYETAAIDMLNLTNTPHAPWHVLAANNKRHARVEVVKRAALAIEQAIENHDRKKTL